MYLEDMAPRTWAVLVALSLIGSSSWAQRPSESGHSEAADGAHTASPPVAHTDGEAAGPERVDPQGITGISPYRQLINQADAELLARSLDEADAVYRQAVASSPHEPLGHLRMGELALKREKWNEAEESIEAALRFSDGDRRAARQARFLLAVLNESLGKLEDAAKAWQDYQALSNNDASVPTPKTPPTPARSTAAQSSSASKKAAAAPPSAAAPSATVAQPFTATVAARLEVIRARQELITAYAAVKDRIQKNVAAAEAVTGSTAAN